MSTDWMKSHRELYGVVPAAPERIGYAELQRQLGWGHRNRVKRTVSTLVGLDVLRWQGMRNGRAVAQGSRTLDEAIALGLQPMPEREIATYPLLLAPINDFLTCWHVDRQDPIDTRFEGDGNDGVTVYSTWARPVGSGQYSRPDLTGIVDLHYPSLGPWNDVHAIEVKPFWSIDRAALFEAIAQASLQRCTYSWLVAWIPDPDSGHFTAQQREQVNRARRLLLEGNDGEKSLAQEASHFGIGLALAEELSEETALVRIQDPTRRVMDPSATDVLFKALGREDGSA